MQWCPIVQQSCKVECAWFVEGECVMVNLHTLAEQLELTQEAINNLNDTIINKNFAE